VGPGAVTVSEVNASAAERVLLVMERDALTRYRVSAAQSLLIGRGESCDVPLRDPRASRQHGVLHVGDALELEDLGSQNGTRVRNERVPSNCRVTLEAGDPIQIGNTLLIVQWVPRGPGGADASDARQAAITNPNVVVQDPAMRSVYELAKRVATSNINVLIYGETGAGKELVAETVHQNSGRRSSGPFVRINCAALSEPLFESEMFGHERGSFTGAVRAKAGLLESADTGTAFLDEIGELSLVVQAKLLRVLESRQLTRVGALSSRAVDVRFVAATNRDLKNEVLRGRFREDLFFRLAGVTLSIPPLRERPSEILLLVRELARALSASMDRPTPSFSSAANLCLQRYRWPGNIRELRNVVEAAVLRCDAGVVEPCDLPPELQVAQTNFTDPALDPTYGRAADAEAVDDVSPLLNRQQAEERARILQGLAACTGNQTRAAELLGIPRRTLVAKLAAYDIPRPRKPRS